MLVLRVCSFGGALGNSLLQAQLIQWDRILMSVNLNAVFPLSNFTGLEVHPFRKRLAPGFEAYQPFSQRQLRLENCRLWLSSHTYWIRFHDGVCCNKVVQSSGVALELFSLHWCYWYLVCWVYLYGVAQTSSIVSRQRLCAPAPPHHGGIDIILSPNLNVVVLFPILLFYLQIVGLPTHYI